MVDPNRKDDGFAGFKPLLRGLLLVLLVAAVTGVLWYCWSEDVADLRQKVHKLLVNIHAAND